MLAVITALAGGAVAAAFPVNAAGTAAGSAAVPALVVALGGAETVDDWIVAALMFEAVAAGGRGMVVTATGLDPFALELAVTELT